MSRIPQPSSRSTPSSPTKARVAGTRLKAGTPTRPRPPTSPSPTPTPTLRSKASSKSLKSSTPVKPTVRRTQPSPLPDLPPIPKTPTLSIKEQIALKRAEAKKVLTKSPAKSTLEFEGLEDASPLTFNQPQEDNIDLGRWSVKETIERARSTGAINLASRSLPCLPSALFEIHLGITPEPLKLVPVEPPITTATSDDPSRSRRKGDNNNGPSWFEAQDLEILKAWSNEIVEIQPELSMFGSLKTIDLHNNQLTTLPDSFADLTALAVLNLSHNKLESLPMNIWALPNLTTLNLSYNNLTRIPFFSPFSAANPNPFSRTVDPRGDWYCETITRATVPLPKLTNLNLSHNALYAAGIDHESENLPTSLTKLDLSFNPLGNSTSLIRAFSRLLSLQELHCEHADIGDDSFPVSLFAQQDPYPLSPFPRLAVLDLGETNVTKPVVEAVFLPTVIKQTVEFEVTPEPPKEGTLRIIVGKRVIKEAWEIEAERRAQMRPGRHHYMDQTSNRGASPTKEIAKESWEVEADQGLYSEGAKRRARAMAALASHSQPSTNTASSSSNVTLPKSSSVVEKEPWEIEAEQGLLTAGGRRRARAQAALATAVAQGQSMTPSDSSRSPVSTPATSPTPSTSVSVLFSSQYYNSSEKALTLPTSTAPSKALHSRSFSLAAKNFISQSSSSDFSLAIPAPTLPLSAILAQPLSHTLKILTISNRRMDPSFCLPTDQEGPFLPLLEELNMENCNICDSVFVAKSQEGSGEFQTPRNSEPLIPLLASLFPSLQSLDLSYNHLTADAFTPQVLEDLILASEPLDDGLPSGPKKGLRHLRLRGNKLTSLEGFQEFAHMFKGFREVKNWKLEELDLRDNEISKLPPEMGLFPLDVFLVDGNTFRVPPRRVWEREGTKGLLSWLRGRIE